MGWADAYSEKQGSMYDLVGQARQQQEAEKQQKSNRGFGLLKLLGGAALMVAGIWTGGATVAPGAAMFSSGASDM